MKEPRNKDPAKDQQAHDESRKQESDQSGTSAKEPNQQDLLRKDLPKHNVSDAVDTFDADEG